MLIVDKDGLDVLTERVLAASPDLVIIADVQDLPCGQGRIRLIDRDALRAVEFDETPPPDRWRLMKPPMSSIPQELQVPLKA